MKKFINKTDELEGSLHHETIKAACIAGKILQVYTIYMIKKYRLRKIKVSE